MHSNKYDKIIQDVELPMAKKETETRASLRYKILCQEISITVL